MSSSNTYSSNPSLIKKPSVLPLKTLSNISKHPVNTKDNRTKINTIIGDVHPFTQYHEVAPSKVEPFESDTMIMFVNGMMNTINEAKESAKLLADIYSHKVELFFNDVEKLETALSSKFKEVSGRILSSLIEYLFCLKKSGKKNIWIFAHNHGVSITKEALSYLHPELRKHISVYAFGGTTLIPDYAVGGKVINSFHSQDWILEVYRRPELFQLRKKLIGTAWPKPFERYHIFERPGPKSTSSKVKSLEEITNYIGKKNSDHLFNSYLPIVKEMSLSQFKE